MCTGSEPASKPPSSDQKGGASGKSDSSKGSGGPVRPVDVSRLDLRVGRILSADKVLGRAGGLSKHVLFIVTGTIQVLSD